MSEVKNSNVAEFFGCNVFSDSVMRERLPKNIYKSVQRTKQLGIALDSEVADVVANAMKDWAVEKGATHYTHWFQPMTGVTAEKHDAFINPYGKGEVILEFSGKELIKGEPDASSFPSGGLRSTFEARGYTAWDPTSCAFIKDDSLYIPTAFCSYTGEILDKKTPLLRSMDVLSTQALRILRLFGNTEATRVTTTVGPEQEYFLIDKKYYDMREDLVITGRTLFGAKPPKGQELEDHYYGNIKQRVSDYMKDLDEELWKLGIYAKTKHNEVAPSQHELAPVFTTSNIAADHNQLTMEIMKKTAIKHGLYCLLHEKPFAGVNGSGKHNNWSMSSNDGQNLLDPGDTPQNNLQFLTFLCAIIKGVHEYAPLLRLSAASAGNDHRLGANEAPPAIVSMFIGSELESVIEALEKGEKFSSVDNKTFEIGVDVLPDFPKDTTDRNRTSPFAFTGNKFEFRMLGSSDSISCTNTILNTIVAEELCQFADELEKSKNFKKDLKALLVKTIKEHKQIIYNGNGYSEEWLKEAVEVRKLPNLVSTVDALPEYITPKSVALFEKFHVYSEAELKARTDVLLENYSKVINIEALTMIDMVKKQILPAVMRYTKEICDAGASKQAMGIPADVEKDLASKLSALNEGIYKETAALESKVITAQGKTGVLETARFYCDEVFTQMQVLRAIVDETETNVSEDVWPLVPYTTLLFSV
ncbi:glutamine synthetase III [Ruminococcus sp. XPD3002]|uniref:glutamine synthetase III family protein n=1 Tax=Ruminococcus sp. XPD3002 TaxID=1452269 RepID=UPI000917ABD5|nr:glutamine synthetase [Ruminococcus flavefaciens]